MDENLIKVTKCELLGELPCLMKLENGQEVTRENWQKRREEIYKTAVELQYGTMPPKPEFLEVEPLYVDGAKHSSYRIITGRRDFPVSFVMRVINAKKKGDGLPPVAIDGDLCFPYSFDKEYINTFIENGVTLVLFNRTELVPDDKAAGRNAPLYNCYPEYTFGAIGAWAWGYSRCVDAISKLGIVDMDNIAFTGHSRGGKTAMLAGVLDERAAIVNPNETCAGACSCYRLEVEAIKEDGTTGRSEMLYDLWNNFGFWMGADMGKYADCPEKLPFDAHFLKAMVAPRVLFVSEAASDIWANPVGSLYTTNAAKPAFSLLGAEDNLIWYYRKGEHYHEIEDVEQLVNIIRHRKFGEPLNDKYFKAPFCREELGIF